MATKTSKLRKNVFKIMLTADERTALELAASKAGYNQLAVWARRVLLEEARELVRFSRKKKVSAGTA